MYITPTSFLLRAKRWNLHVYFDCISQSLSALCLVSGVSYCDLVWSRDTRRELYTGGISRPSSRFNDGLRCLMLMASLTLRFIYESSDVKILVFCGLILCPVCIQCSYMAELDLAMCSFSLMSKERPVSPM